jgi:hypothetical protein
VPPSCYGCGVGYAAFDFLKLTAPSKLAFSLGFYFVPSLFVFISAYNTPALHD